MDEEQFRESVEDEPPLDREMLQRIVRAPAERGPGIPYEEILREFGA